MFDPALTGLLRRLGAKCCLRIYGKGKRESHWRIIDVVATSRRNLGSGWPFLQGSCTTWTSSIIAVNWGFARAFMEEQLCNPSSRELPTAVVSGRLRIAERRLESAGSAYPSCSEVMAHECGHTAQARRLGMTYLPLVGPVTLCREGDRWWNHWENNASEQGLMGGIAEIVRPVEDWPA